MTFKFTNVLSGKQWRQLGLSIVAIGFALLGIVLLYVMNASAALTKTEPITTSSDIAFSIELTANVAYIGFVEDGILYTITIRNHSDSASGPLVMSDPLADHFIYEEDNASASTGEVS